jgi:hypothetical protein
MRKSSFTRRQQLTSIAFLASLCAAACSSDDDKAKAKEGIVYNPAADWTTLAYDTRSAYWNKAETSRR